MSTRMLIDARHKEETRVTIVKGNRVEDFDYESASKVQLKGNIYLAKVTRVEPSLQAAFVDYGGNRHGFLAFSEIHPDYYQIPIEDREALLKEEEEILRAEEAELAKSEKKSDDKKEKSDKSSKSDKSEESDKSEKSEKSEKSDKKSDKKETDNQSDDDNSDSDTDQDMEERIKKRHFRTLKRRYKIQEVIKRRQILLIQVVKEERGNKGAALTSYLSLAGRYSVLMPNSTHGGGISRKIANSKDRKRLKGILESINIPSEIGVIIRTAGLSRTKVEIKRDIDYLRKIWEGIRDLTMKSVAPSLIYEEGNLIKRTIRDLYDRNIEEVLVEGENGFKTAKNFMTLLMPSHSKKVRHYQDSIPLFHRYQVESQLEAMYDPTVTLKSGGYLVINPTEALIAIDVNSGRSTKERHIEETALKTNLEAAEEVARQLRLRDMAGLVVIDFIDMEERSHNRKIERKIKEALKADRARIQVSRISSLGLMEISRQRLHPNLVENSTHSCPLCEGTGRVRTIESAALHVIRGIEEEGIRGKSANLVVSLAEEIAIYILNKKRAVLTNLEEKYGFKLSLRVDNSLNPPKFELEKSGVLKKKPTPVVKTITPDMSSEEDFEEVQDNNDSPQKKDDQDGNRRRRRRGRRGPRRRNEYNKDSQPSENNENEKVSEEEDSEETQPKRRRRRGKRGGRNKRNHPQNVENKEEDTIAPSSSEPSNEEKPKEEKPKRARKPKAKPEADNETKESKPLAKRGRPKKAKSENEVSDKTTETPEEPKKKTRGRPKKAAPAAKKEDKVKKSEKPKKDDVKATKDKEPKASKDKKEAPKAKSEEKPKEDNKPKKKGWWQRVKG